MNMNPKTQKRETGMALIVALLVTAIVLSIGINIANIATKQLILSSFSKESSKALFMADSMIECVLYWDQTTEYSMISPGRDDDEADNGKYFFRTPGATPSAASNIDPICFERTISRDESVSGDTITTEVTLFGNNPTPAELAPPCAVATIEKTLLSGGAVVTMLTARGYNTCDPDNPRRVERGLEIEY